MRKVILGLLAFAALVAAPSLTPVVSTTPAMIAGGSGGGYGQGGG